MTLFRSGTTFYDEVAVELAEYLGYTAVNFDLLGDAGATFSASQVKQAVPLLREEGFEFVLLKNQKLK